MTTYRELFAEIADVIEEIKDTSDAVTATDIVKEAISEVLQRHGAFARQSGPDQYHRVDEIFTALSDSWGLHSDADWQAYVY